MRHLWAIVAIAATSSAMAETPNDKELRACLTEAMANYAKAKVAAIGATRGALTIDYYMAGRRFEEAYCVEYARCVVTFTKPAENLIGVVAGTQFASCLADEAAERAEK
jgi:hypothetical protein